MPNPDPLEELKLAHAQRAGMFLDQVEDIDLQQWHEADEAAIAAWEHERVTAETREVKLMDVIREHVNMLRDQANWTNKSMRHFDIHVPLSWAEALDRALSGDAEGK